MKRQKSTGKCHLCGETLGRTVMTRHLSRCGRPQPSASVTAAARKKTVKCFHLAVEGRYDKDYWMHLALPVQGLLSKLDGFLRGIWLECCGHLSAFSIAGQRYSSAPMLDYEERGMRVPLDRILEVGTKFSYEYDYSSTTELVLKVAAIRDQETRGAVQLLARNDPPKIHCDACNAEKLATQICTECVWSGHGWLCESCAAEHECDSDMFLPVVNSPRVGVCGYTG